jgi:hypothetical protein
MVLYGDGKCVLLVFERQRSWDGELGACVLLRDFG